VTTGAVNRPHISNGARVAVIGLACRFPEAPDAKAFWRLLVDGRDAIREMPEERFSRHLFDDAPPGAPGKIVARRGGFLEHVDLFDAAFFGLSPREAALVDPQQRLLLEVSWEALEHAGLTGAQLAGSDAGVFAAIWTNDYERLVAPPGSDPTVFAATGTGRYAAAGRISYAFDLRGPSVTLDTACSSSLVALHLACQSLRTGECDVAIVGATNLILDPLISVAYSRSGLLSPTGACHFGSARADGYVRSEGVAAVVLKRVSTALEHGDRILAVVAGSAVSNDGRGSGSLMAPSVSGQAAGMRAACRAAGIEPRELSYVEAHGTGTLVGDPVEIGSIAAALGESTEPGRCLVGSVKTNIGHTEAAAGLAGLIKVVLALRYGTLPPSLHAEDLNPEIAWDRLPLSICRHTTPWPPPRRRLACVNSFGITGTNAHVIVEDPPQAPGAVPPSDDESPQLVALSAMSRQSLASLAERWQAHDWEGAAFADVAYTSTARRTHHAHRLAMVVSGFEELRAALQGRVAPVSPLARLGERRSMLETTTQLYEAGGDVDWHALHRRPRPLASLPSYAWQRERFWVDLRTNQLTGDGQPQTTAHQADANVECGPRPDTRGHVLNIVWGPVTTEFPLRCPSRRWCVIGRDADGIVALSGAAGKRRVSFLEAPPDALAEPARLRDLLAANDPEMVVLVVPGAGANLEATWEAVEPELMRKLLDLTGIVRVLAERPSPPSLWVVTRNGEQADLQDGTRGVDPTSGAVLGLLRVALAEHPELAGGSIDIHGELDLITADVIIQHLLETPPLRQIAVRNGRRLTPRLTRAPDTGRRLTPRATGSYLITGGLGGVGLAHAHRLVSRGARDIVLVGRRELPPRETWRSVAPASEEGGRIAAVAALEALGARVRVSRLDVSDARAVESTLAALEAEGPPIKGVVHAAVVVQSALLEQSTPEHFRQGIRAKAAGAWNLHRHFRERPLDFFVCCSSIGAVLGVPGQAAYAAANAFVDTLIHLRRGNGSCGNSVNWGAWSGTGLARSEARVTLEFLASEGLGPVLPEEALDAFEAIVAQDLAQAVVVAADPDRLSRSSYREAYPELLGPLATVPPAHAASHDRGMRARLADVAPRTRAAILQRELSVQLAAVLHLAPERIDPRTPFGSLGLESLLALQFQRRVEQALDEKLPRTVAFQHPTIEKLTEFLLSRLFPQHTPQTGGTRATLQTPSLELSEDDALAALLGGQESS
jgi:acyl transferase domain-containing protein